jgi:microtubule-associated protein-like 6
MDFFKDQILVCTNSSSIYEFPISEKNPKPQALMTAHYKGELWAESWSPDKTRFVTGGDDCTLRIFDISTLQQTHFFKMKEKVRGLDWEQTGNDIIVVGDYKGKIYLFDSELNPLDEAKTKFSKTKPRQEPFWIEDIKFSPNGQYVAFGAHGGASHL